MWFLFVGISFYDPESKLGIEFFIYKEVTDNYKKKRNVDWVWCF